MDPDLEVVDTDRQESFKPREHGYPFRTVGWRFRPEFEIHHVVNTTGRYFGGDFIGTFATGKLVLTRLNLPQLGERRPGRDRHRAAQPGAPALGIGHLRGDAALSRAPRLCRDAREQSPRPAVAITEVCLDSGFDNLSNFNRQFLAQKCMTSSRFRALMRTRASTPAAACG